MSEVPSKVWINGTAVGSADAKVSVFDRGFLYGDSVFETLRTYGGRPFALGEHLERLLESARRVCIDLPVGLDLLAAEVRRAVELSAFDESYLRLMVTRGTGELGLDPGHATKPLRVLLVAPLTTPSETDYAEGIAVITFATSRAGDATAAAGAKIGNYLVAVLAHRAAAQKGAKEALIADAAGRVVEGATSNVFWCKDGTLRTPPLEAGILAGVTRAHILRVAGALGRSIAFAVPTRDELWAADEVFVSSSIRELMPVTQLDGVAIGSGRPGPVTRDLLDHFRAHCLAEVGLSAG